MKSFEQQLILQKAIHLLQEGCGPYSAKDVGAAILGNRSEIDRAKPPAKTPFMSPDGRPRDIIDAIEAICGADGHFAPVDEDYYGNFLALPAKRVENLAVLAMLDQEKAVRQVSGGQWDEAAVERVAKMVQTMFVSISIGLARFDAFGVLGFVARIGPEPSEEVHEALQEKYAEIAPVITKTVRRTLPWMLSRVETQGELPL